jgi:GTPase SAR1 family protein
MLNNKKFEEAAIKKSFCKIGIIGDVKVGKTFLLSKIIKKNIDDNFEGYNQLIKSLKLKLFKENYLFIEGIGFNMSYSYIGNETNKEEKILIGQLNELFIKHYIYNVCDLIIIIVEELNQSELERLYNLKYFFKGKKLIIVHNMKKLNKKEFMNYGEEISKKEFKVEKTKIINLEGKNVDNYIYLENLKDEDEDNSNKTVFVKENSNNNNNNRIENQEIIHLFIGNDNIDEIKKINEEIFSYIIKQIEINFIQNINLNEKFCFEKILKSNLNSFSKKYLLIKHIHTKGNDYSENSLSNF